MCKGRSDTLTACSRLSPSLQLANSVSLPLQTLDLNLLRIQRRRKAAAAAASSKQSSRSPTAAPRCTILPAGSSSRPPLPCSSSQVAQKAFSPADGRAGAGREGEPSAVCAQGSRAPRTLRTNAHMQAGRQRVVLQRGNCPVLPVRGSRAVLDLQVGAEPPVPERCPYLSGAGTCSPRAGQGLTLGQPVMGSCSFSRSELGSGCALLF